MTLSRGELRSPGATPAEFSNAFSRYVDGFLARRSVLDSSLFPEKPAQMWFGYETVGAALGDLTAWLRQRLDADELGRSFHRIGPQAPGILPACALWMYHAALTGWDLEGRPWPSDAPEVLEYWRTVFESYSEAFDPPGVFQSGASAFRHRLVDDATIQDAASRLDGAASQAAGPMLAAATNYSWLTEAESRQGTYNHGLYEVDSGRILVREFVNLAATRYPWIDQGPDGLPGAPLSVVLMLQDVDGDFDVYGVPRLEPQNYVDRITGAAVKVDQEWVDAPGPWIEELSGRIRSAHLALFRTIAGWTPHKRFVAGASSYLAMYAPVIEIAGGTEDDIQTLLLEPLGQAVADRLPAHLERQSPAELWGWVAGRGTETIFAPVVRKLS